MRSRDDELWSRVNEALDAREDPLADRAVLDLLRDQPERAVEIESLTRALEAIAQTEEQGRSVPTPTFAALGWGPRAAVPRRTSLARRAVAAAAALVFVVAGLSYWVATRPAAPSPAPPTLHARDVVRAFSTGASPVASWSVRVERRDAAVTTSDSLGSDGVRATDTSTVESNADSARIVVHSFTRHP